MSFIGPKQTVAEYEVTEAIRAHLADPEDPFWARQVEVLLRRYYPSGSDDDLDWVRECLFASMQGRKIDRFWWQAERNRRQATGSGGS